MKHSCLSLLPLNVLLHKAAEVKALQLWGDGQNACFLNFRYIYKWDVVVVVGFFFSELKKQSIGKMMLSTYNPLSMHTSLTGRLWTIGNMTLKFSKCTLLWECA